MSQQKESFLWRTEPEILEWIKNESERLRKTTSATIEIATKFWRAHVEQYGDDPWLIPSKKDETQIR